MPEIGDKLPILIWFWGRRGGGARFTLELTQILAANDRLHVHLSISRNNFLFDRFNDLGLDTHAVTTYTGVTSAVLASMRLPLIRRAFLEYIRGKKIQVVLSTMPHQWTFAMIGGIRYGGARLVSIIHECEKKRGEILVIPDFTTRREATKADHVITLSQFVRQKLISRFGLKPECSSVVCHPGFKYSDDYGPLRIFPADRPFRLLFLGRIRQHKGIDLLLEAYESLRKDGREFDLTIAGSGDLKPYIRILNDVSGIHAINRWIEESEVPQFLEEADLLVAPYRQASQSGIIPAAYRQGLPVVVTPTGGLVEQVDHMKTGIVAGEINATALADAIALIMNDRTLYERCSKGAISTARGRMSWEAVSARITDIITAVAETGTAPC